MDHHDLIRIDNSKVRQLVVVTLSFFSQSAFYSFSNLCNNGVTFPVTVEKFSSLIQLLSSTLVDKD